MDKLTLERLVELVETKPLVAPSYFTNEQKAEFLANTVMDTPGYLHIAGETREQTRAGVRKLGQLIPYSLTNTTVISMFGQWLLFVQFTHDTTKEKIVTVVRYPTKKLARQKEFEVCSVQQHPFLYENGDVRFIVCKSLHSLYNLYYRKMILGVDTAIPF